MTMPLAAVLAGAPTAERWAAVCEAMGAVSGDALASALSEARETVKRWPAALRRIGPDSPWLRGLFDGQLDPRLELVGHASIHHRHEYRYMASPVRTAELLRVVEALARHLDAAFDPPDVLLGAENDIRYASGCGGGEAWEKRGSATQWLAYRSWAVEHSADMETDESWTAHGLAEGASIAVTCNDYIGGAFDFSASGDVPAVLELASAWRAVVGGASLEEVRAVLERSHVPWTWSPLDP